MGGSFLDNLFSESNFKDLAWAVNQAGRKLRDAFSINRFFSEQTNQIIQSAAQLAYSLGNREVDSEHVLFYVLAPETVKTILKNLQIQPEQVQGYLQHTYFARQSRPRHGSFDEMDLSLRVKAAAETAFMTARDLGHNYIGPEHMLIALCGDEDSAAGQLLKKFGVRTAELKQQVIAVVGRGDVEQRSNTRKLDRYSRDLTALARAGKHDPVIGRSEEIETVIEILARRKKNNPILIGEPGVGKTAIVEAIAQRVVGNAVPDVLRGRRVVELNLNSLLSGAQYRGQFEERVKGILDEILRHQDELILFIDEIHTLVGAGSATEGTLDAANIFKPALARGELHMIGATTLNEYQKYFERDAALERRFQPVFVGEPTVAQTIDILNGLKDRLEAHHRVSISEESIVGAAELADRYIANRFLPDKAIDLLDQAAARMRINATSPPAHINEIQTRVSQLQREVESATRHGAGARISRLQAQLQEQQRLLNSAVDEWRARVATASVEVGLQDIAAVVSRLTGIPVADLSAGERQKLLNIEAHLRRRVIGQDRAVQVVGDAVRLSRAGLRKHKRPIATLFFIGPSGVGKTELAKALAEVVFGDEDAIIRLDMSEFAQQHAVARLVGAPPGYVGHEEGGQLTERVRRRPYSVVLLDEIEKAHPDAHNLLLPVFEEGRLTDSKGRTVDFTNTVLITTSNLDLATLRQYFSAEFLNRVDDFVEFQPLSHDTMLEIAAMHLRQLAADAKQRNIRLTFDQALIEHLATAGNLPGAGARELRRLIRSEVETALSTSLLRGDLRPGQAVHVSFDEKTGRVRLT
jgi:ATP-dependent Clp protease ATP-binding subunit ClpC